MKEQQSDMSVSWVYRHYLVILGIASLLIVVGTTIAILDNIGILPWPVQWVRRTILIFALIFVVVGAIIWLLSGLGILPGPQSTVWRVRRVIVTFIILLFGIGAAGWMLIQPGIVPDPWANIPSVFSNVLSFFLNGILILLAFLALVPSLNSYRESQSSTTVPPSSSPVSEPIYRGIIASPPPTHPKTIQQRKKAVEDIYGMLIQSDITAVALTGIGGIGKSTLAALVYNYAEEQHRNRKGPFLAEALWLRVDPSVTFVDLAGNLFKALSKRLPDMSNSAPHNQAVILFNVLNTVEKPRLVILDQFENLLDQAGYALTDRPGVGEWLDVINSQVCRCKILFTSYSQPKGIHEYPRTCMREYEVKGLKVMEAMDLLRKHGVQATEAEVQEVIKRCEGHPLSITLLVSLLQGDQSLKLNTLLNDPLYTEFWNGQIARNVLNYIYRIQLDQTQRKLLLAFSVYRETVPLSAAFHITDIPKAQVPSALEGLLALHLLEAPEQGGYRLHAIVANYVRDHFDESSESANFRAMQAAHAKAARYYQQRAATSCPPREKRQRMSDVLDLVEAIWQYCQAGQWQKAYDLMEQERIFSDLNRWGGNAKLLELYQQLRLDDKWHPKRSQAEHVYSELARLYQIVGEKKEALKYYEQALSIQRKLRDYHEEATTLNNLGRVYNALGDQKKAVENLEQALKISREVGDRKLEGTALNNLVQPRGSSAGV